MLMNPMRILKIVYTWSCLHDGNFCVFLLW